jgi:hypothetical protein
LKLFKVYDYVDGNGKTIFFVCSRDTSVEVLRIEHETDGAVNLRLRYRTSAMYVLKFLNPESRLNRDLLHAVMEIVGLKC